MLVTAFLQGFLHTEMLKLKKIVADQNSHIYNGCRHHDKDLRQQQQHTHTHHIYQ